VVDLDAWSRERSVNSSDALDVSEVVERLVETGRAVGPSDAKRSDVCIVSFFQLRGAACAVVFDGLTRVHIDRLLDHPYYF